MAVSEGRLFKIHEELISAKTLMEQAIKEHPGDIKDDLNDFAYGAVCEALNQFTLIDQPVEDKEEKEHD